MGILKKIMKLKIPKTVTGLLIVGVGVGVSFIPVPAAQAIGAKIIYSGGAVVIAGVTAKAYRAKKAGPGQKWIAVTEHERETIKKLRKKGK